MIRLLLVEGQPQVLRGLRMRLAAESDMVVIGEAEDGTAVPTLVAALNPDIVLIDVDMPGVDWAATANALHLVRPHAAVIIVSLHDDDRTLALASDAGAAFVSKSTPTENLLAAIRHVSQARCAQGKGDGSMGR